MPLIVILNMGTAIEMESWKNKVDAILLVWEPGTVVAKPAAAVLTGAANPSGKMPTSWPVNVTGIASNGYNNTPAQDNFGSSSDVTYAEGIFVGYRYYDTFNVPVSCEFGFGLNYSDFDLNNLQLSSDTFGSLNDTLNVSVDVKNVSKVSGKEVVQLYVGAPGRSMQKPVKELRRFAKTRELAANETQTMKFTLDAKSLTSFDDVRSAWVVEPGTYVVYAATSSKEIRQVATFTVPQELVVETTSNALAPTTIFAKKVSPLFNAPPTCTSFVRVKVKANLGMAPALPTVVQAVYSDGTIPIVSVTWDNIDPASYAKPGTFTVNGTVSGTALKAVANVSVTGIAETALVGKISQAQGSLPIRWLLGQCCRLL
jgi:Fibronectin type III-like domain/Glycosyl hydrolase family 3 C-terminal domain/Bacterial Ig-like domain (group 4)